MEMLLQGKLHILKWWASIKKNVNHTHITKRAWTAYRNKYTGEIIQWYFVEDIKNNYSLSLLEQSIRNIQSDFIWLE